MNLIPGATLTSAVLGFLVIMAWRIGESRSAVTARKIVIPPMGMATGFCMFLAPGFRMPWTWAVAAFLVGALLLAEPLIRTSHLKLVGETVMMHRSPAFFFVIVVLALVRFLARGVSGPVYYDRAVGWAVFYSGVWDDRALAGDDVSGVSAGDAGGGDGACGWRKLASSL